jgi:hypothetical protein
LGHAKRLAAGFEHANDGVALGADGKFRADRRFPLIEEFFDEVCANDRQAVRGLSLLTGEIPSALHGVSADIEVVFFDAQHLNVGVGPLRASGQRRLGGSEDGVGDGQFFGGLLCESLRLFVGNGLADSHPSPTVHAGLGFLREGENVRAEGRELLHHIGLQRGGRRGHADQGHDAQSDDANGQAGAQPISSNRTHGDLGHFNKQFSFHVLRKYCLPLRSTENPHHDF